MLRTPVNIWMASAGVAFVKTQSVCGDGVTLELRNRHFFCRSFKASSNNSRMTLPRVLRSSPASRSISSSKATGSRTETPTDSGSCLIFAISLPTWRVSRRDVLRQSGDVWLPKITCNHYDYIVIFRREHLPPQESRFQRASAISPRQTATEDSFLRHFRELTNGWEFVRRNQRWLSRA